MLSISHIIRLTSQETSNALWLELGQEGDVNDTVLTHDYIYDVTPYLPAGVFSATGAGV